MDGPIERAAECIRLRYQEPISLAEIADYAGLSRFYLCRRFRAIVGVTPGRFLSAIRIYEAKRLLHETPLKVVDVSFAVGYNSLGSFTNAFTRTVGYSPGEFRRRSLIGGPFLEQRVGGPDSDHAGAIAGTISIPGGFGAARAYLGAFPTPLIRHAPVASAIVDVPVGRPVCYQLPLIPDGVWFVRAVAAASPLGAAPSSATQTLVGGGEPVSVFAGTTTSAAVRLRSAVPTDLPVLLALPELSLPTSVPASVGCPATQPRSRDNPEVRLGPSSVEQHSGHAPDVPRTATAVATAR